MQVTKCEVSGCWNKRHVYVHAFILACAYILELYSSKQGPSEDPNKTLQMYTYNSLLPKQGHQPQQCRSTCAQVQTAACPQVTERPT